MKTIALGALLTSLLWASAAHAVLYKFEVPLDGSQEVPVPGDPDGTGWAELEIDSDLLTITWNITLQDVGLPIRAAHIHNAPAGNNGPVRIDFSAQLSGGPIFDPDLAGVLADPTQWYVNVHNESFPAGAVRGQLSAPVRGVAEGGVGLSAAAAWGGLLLLASGRRGLGRIRRGNP
ncbi:MAG: CHRD domain-containing protein [Verrucomicrobiales bacterium]